MHGKCKFKYANKIYMYMSPTVQNQLGPMSSLFSIPSSGMKTSDVPQPIAITLLMLGDDSLITLQRRRYPLSGITSYTYTIVIINRI